MKRRILLLLVLQFSFAAMLEAKDYALIEQLPQRLARAKAESQKGWDSGITATMKEATYRYNDTLTKMIKDLVGAYYPKDFLTEEDINGYLKSLYTIRRFRQHAANPTGESQGTMAGLQAPGEVSEDLERAIADMVQVLVKDGAKFDYKGWKKKWQQAQK